jgi:hypothetical protein
MYGVLKLTNTIARAGDHLKSIGRVLATAEVDEVVRITMNVRKIQSGA